MRRLILMRHAKAERGSATGEDFDRALSERGVADAALMGRVLAAAKIAPDRALVSSANRTQQTWDAVRESFPRAGAIVSRSLYLAEPDEIEDAIEANTDAGTVIVIAHNPGIHALAYRLLERGSAPPSIMARLDRGFPTSTAAAFLIDEAGRASYDGFFLVADHGGGGGE